MRARNLKPGFFKNEDLAECEPLARILFSGLWCMADRSGRLEFRPKRIKAEVLPYDNCNIEKLLKQLSDKNFILIYAVNNDNYIEILNFGRHQNPHCKEAESLIPAPVKHSANTVQAPDENGSRPADSPFLIPDSGFPLPDSPIQREAVSQKKAKQPALSDDDFLKSLKDNPVYEGLDVDELYQKMLVWCKTNGKKPTKRRFVNWLNREERPLQARKLSANQAHEVTPYTTCPSCGAEVLKDDFIESGGKMICPKCPVSREITKQRLNDLVGGMLKSIQ